MCAYDTSQNNVIDTQIINQYSVATVEMYTVFSVACIQVIS